MELSILLGSGFSAPAGLPLVSDINNVMRSLQKENFWINLNKNAGFFSPNDGNKDPNNVFFFNRLFAQDWINFYCNEKLNNISDFNYEVFYDYNIDVTRYGKDEELTKNFCEVFRTKWSVFQNIGDNNLINDFLKIYQQLIGSLLIKPEFEQGVSYGSYSCNSGFFRLIQKLIADGIVNVHTLNHDIFFEHVMKFYDSVGDNFSDGFSELGSNIYGQAIVPFEFQGQRIERTYTVRLPMYTGEYNGKLRLYKLHGSVDNYYMLDGQQTRFKRQPGINSFKVESISSSEGKLYYQPVLENLNPDFLTGTTTKVQQYDSHFYNNLLSHFKRNLSLSSCLLVIGYGFCDPGINEILQSDYLSHGKRMAIVDVRQPEADLVALYPKQMTFFTKGIDIISYDELEQLIN